MYCSEHGAQMGILHNSSAQFSTRVYLTFFPIMVGFSTFEGGGRPLPPPRTAMSEYK